MAVSIALLLLSALWEDVSAQDNSFCADQPESIQVRVGVSVTIPCRFSMPMQYKSDEVRVYWRAGTGNRCGSSPFIYNHTQGMTHANYSGRLTLVGDPERRRTGSIRIDRLTEADSMVKYCCRLEIIERDKPVLSWQNNHMTRLLLAGGPRQSFVDQLDAIPALEGGSVTIPCRYSHPGEWGLVQVIWKAGSGGLCSDFEDIYAAGNVHDNYKGRVTLVADPRGSGPSSLNITDLQVSDSRRYCCRVQIRTQDRREEWVESSHGTHLIVGGRKPIPGFNVKQSEEITAQKGKSVTMNCTYTHPTDRDPLWIGVYWTVGDQWEKCVYDPNKESIHDDYRERTRLIGDPELNNTVSLEIDNVAEMDNQTYYCLVVFQFCDGNNVFASKLQQGEGTRLAVEEDVSAHDSGFCADQPESIQVQVGVSVTIPCRFSMPMQYKSDEVRVNWRAGTGNRCRSSPFIYNHTQGMTHTNYSGRITLVGDPERRRTGSIRIDRLTEADSMVKYCCRLEIIERDKPVLSWQSKHMTRLLLAGGPRQSYVDQLDTIPALEGGSVTIPCRYSHPGEWGLVQVIWKAGSGGLCSDFEDIYAAGNVHDKYKGRVTLVAEPAGRGPSSLPIRDLQLSDSRRYCCTVQIRTQDGREEWIESSHGTDLIVGGRKPIPGYSVKQSEEITAQKGKSITMNCTYTHPTDRDPLWIGVYWMVGDQWEKFVYDPNKESIHDDYRERTRLIGDTELSNTVSLQIDNVAEMDSQTYYCLLAFRFCDGNNLFTSKLQQGEGTRLAMQDQNKTYSIWLIVAAALPIKLAVMVLLMCLLVKKSQERELVGGPSVDQRSRGREE